MAEDDVHRVELRAKSIDELRTFLDGTDIDLGCRPVVRKSATSTSSKSIRPFLRSNGYAARGVSRESP